MDTTTATRRCTSCTNGTHYTSRQAQTCLACGGTGRLPAPVCPVCDGPMLDEHPLRWVLGAAQHAVHGATWKVTEAEHVEAPCLIRDVVGASQPTQVSRTYRDGDEVVLVLRLGGEVRLLPWRPVDHASLR